jgi:phosphoribosylanthranilate isomerase
VLLIARFLGKQELREMLRTCRELCVNALVEITDEKDLEKLEDPIKYMGVNSRDLQTLQVNISKFEILRKNLPDAFLIAESGIHSRETLDRVIELGYHGALIGEHFLRASDPAGELAAYVRRSRPPVRVKICGITNERDALMAVDAGANALGFIFADSPRRIDPAALAAIRPKIPSGVLCAGIFLGQSKADIESTMRRFDLHLAQIYDNVQPELPVWMARRIHSAPASRDRIPELAVLWDVKAEESRLPGIWEALAQQPVFALAGGLHPENVAHAIESCRPAWVDVARGVEKEPGIKDPERLNAFLRALR